ncbi:MAG TPA: hypothetical protein VLD67_02245, partial [Vicinamibacterales bacterium]|nr:hypothetical protein [Vicinamibacterales bacterium]
WGADGTIVFGSAGLYQVSAAGGQPERLTTADPEQGEVEHRWPEILPGGRAVLFTVWTGSVDRSRIAVRSLATGRQDVLIDGASHARYLRDGYLAYSLSGALMAAAFDPETLALTGERVPMQESLDTSVSGAADFAITRDGTLVFVPGAAGPERGLVWVDREGQVSSLIETREDYWLPRLSPDGNRLAVGIGSDLWVFALGRLTRTRITFGSTSTLFPYTWSSDGRRITFSKVEKKVGLDIYSVSADGTGQPQLIAESEHRQWATSWSPDGNTMALYEQHPVTQRDIWILPGKGQRTAFLATPFQERAARFSPDGRWLAYVSNDSGRDEVYVRPYPGPGEKITVSTDGGSEPVWSANGREIFYRNGERMMAAPIEDVPAFAVGRPQLLFTGGFDPDRGSGSANASYDVTRDGKRFVMITPPAASSHIIVVLNWVEELKARLAAR